MRPVDWRLLAVLALSKSHSASFRDLLERLWPDRQYHKLLDDDADDLDVEHLASRERIIQPGLNDLYNSASRLRNFLRAAAGMTEDDPDPLPRKMNDAFAAGGYRLVLPGTITVDAVDFVSLVKEGTDEARLAAIRLVQGRVLDLDDHPAPQYLRNELTKTVKNVARMLLPAASEALLERIAREVVLEGDMLTLEGHRLGLYHGHRVGPDTHPADHLLPHRIESSSLSDVAQTTFRDLVRNWAGGAAVTTPADNVVIASLPSQWGDAVPIRLTFLLFTSDTAPTIEADRDGARCRRHVLSARELRELTEYVTATPAPHAYFVLAVPRTVTATETQLLDGGITERFTFYATDAAQALQRASEDNALEFPEQNTMNLAVFSLLWASRWVQNFFDPLHELPVIRNKLLSGHINLVFNKQPPLEEIKRRGWGPLVDDLPRMRGEFDKELFNKVSFRLGMGSAMQLINKQMIDAGRSLTDVRTYCPEALFGTAALWLFSRFYHQFMGTTRDFQRARTGFVNQRLLPILTDPTSLPRMFAATLWHVVLTYRVLEAEVRIVAKPPEGGEADHGYYGGGIGKFQWIALTENGPSWVREQESRAIQREHRVFIHDATNETIVGPETSAEGFAAISGITPTDQLNLGRLKPKWLFPLENQFIEHPTSLWSPRIVSASNQGIRF
ncbi:MAG: hypothetical protein ACR2QA_14755 [Solirubrobacteraceae bacterium]